MPEHSLNTFLTEPLIEMPESIQKFIYGADLENAYAVMRALAHPLRLKIMRTIHEHGTIHVNRIYTLLQIEQSIASQHLRVLRDAGLVTTTREGKYIHYSLHYDRIKQIASSIDTFLAS